MSFDDVAAHLEKAPGALDEFTAYLGELDKQTDAVNYFGYSDRRSPDGATGAGSFDARLDYDTLRTAKYLRELAGQPPAPLNRATTAAERETRRPQLEIEPWSYKHGAGFGISDALRARERAALQVRAGRCAPGGGSARRCGADSEDAPGLDRGTPDELSVHELSEPEFPGNDHARRFQAVAGAAA
jgi:hypothetical protein